MPQLIADTVITLNGAAFNLPGVVIANAKTGEILFQHSNCWWENLIESLIENRESDRKSNHLRPAETIQDMLVFSKGFSIVRRPPITYTTVIFWINPTHSL